MTREEFKPTFKRLMRQLSERSSKVENKQRPDSYYQSKRTEFVSLIDNAIKQGWFVMPKKGTRIWNTYYDKWY